MSRDDEKSKSPDIHTIPKDDYIDHEESQACICGPEWTNKHYVLIGEHGCRIYLHRRMKDKYNIN